MQKNKKNNKKHTHIVSRVSKFRILILLLIVGVIGLLYVQSRRLDRYNALSRQTESLTRQGNVQQGGHVPPITSQDHYKGNPKAKITVVEYSDLECPSCKDIQPTVTRLLHYYETQIRWIVRNYPLPQHINAAKEAEAAECAAQLGGNAMYWTYSDAVFTRSTMNGTGFALEQLTPLAKELGLHTQEFESCLDSGKNAKLVSQQTIDAQAAGAYELPAVFIIDSKGTTRLVGGSQPFAVYKTILDMNLAEL